MSVDVSYEGIVIARGAEVKETPAGQFLALETPMPVGTTLRLHDGSSEHGVRVTRVHEGVCAGVIVAPASGSTPPSADGAVAASNLRPATVTRGTEGPLLDDGRITLPGIEVDQKELEATAAGGGEPEHSAEPGDDGDKNGDGTRRGRRRRRTRPPG
jgi:hypothetical protein